MISLRVHVYFMRLGANYLFSSELAGTILFQYKIESETFKLADLADCSIGS